MRPLNSEKTYQLAEKPVPIISWEEYVAKSGVEYRDLLQHHSAEEKVFQEFFERNPAYVPGGCDLNDGSGHWPYPLALITKPALQGSFERIPDFMWLASYSATFHPILIEIEAPAKLCFRTDNGYTQDIQHALEQLRHWRMWMEESDHHSMFVRRFRLITGGLTGIYLAENRFVPKYLLIYGRRKEIKSDSKKRKLREQLTDSGIQIRSYDGLTPSYKCKDCFTVRLTEQGYEAVEIMPTLQISPSTAEQYAMVAGKEQAIVRNRYLSEERKRFLVDRFKYWDEWVQNTPREQRKIFDCSYHE